MLIVDEASRVPDEVYSALMPSLAVSNGDLIILSTPWDKRGFFFKVMSEGDAAEWLKHTGAVTECPRVTEAFLEQERALRGEEEYRREYLCQFTETGKYVFNDEELLKMENREEQAWRLV